MVTDRISYVPASFWNEREWLLLASTATTAVISIAASTTAAKENQDNPDAVTAITSAATATVISKTISAAGEEKKNLKVADLLAKFEEVSGGEFANDRMMLS